MKAEDTSITAQMPHEVSSAKAEANTPQAKKSGKAAAKNKKSKKKAKTTATSVARERDAFGGRIGSRMSNINLVVINAGATGATVPEVAEKTGESAAIVSAQLGWAVNKLKVATRKEEKPETGRKTFRYFAKVKAS